MKKYKIKLGHPALYNTNNLLFNVYTRTLLFFWSFTKSFDNKDEAIKYVNTLEELDKFNKNEK